MKLELKTFLKKAKHIKRVLTCFELVMTATLKEIRGKTEHYFISKGVPNAKLDADLIIAHCLGIKRLDIYLSLERPIYEQELNAIRNCVRRRGQREPLHILGYTELFNYRLKVDPRALIPGQETEYLIELCLPLVVNQARCLIWEPAVEPLL